jgi:hypothetical protein
VNKHLWREHPLGLSAKNSSPRVKKLSAKIKTLGEEFLHREPNKLSAKNSSPRANQMVLGEEILRREFFSLGEEILKNHVFTFKLFLSSTCTYTKDMFTFDVILSLFAIFKNYTSF